VLDPSLSDRVPAHAEARTDARELERRAQESLAQVLALRGVVAVAEMHRAEGLAVVRELGGEQAAGAHRAPAEIVNLVDHGELITLAQVAVEVDIAAEDIAELHGDAVGDAGIVGGGEERALDHGRFHGDSRIELGAVVGDAEVAVRLGGDLHQRVAPAQEAERDRLAVGADFGADMRPGLELLQHAQLGEAPRVRAFDAKALKKRGQRIAALEELLAVVGLRRRHGVRANRQVEHDRRLLRHACALRRVRDGRERHHAGSGEENDHCDAAKASVRAHESARIP
jgi:hypothetical protein